jgi:hypothetical protein
MGRTIPSESRRSRSASNVSQARKSRQSSRRAPTDRLVPCAVERRGAQTCKRRHTECAAYNIRLAFNLHRSIAPNHRIAAGEPSSPAAWRTGTLSRPKRTPTDTSAEGPTLRRPASAPARHRLRSRYGAPFAASIDARSARPSRGRRCWCWSCCTCCRSVRPIGGSVLPMGGSFRSFTPRLSKRHGVRRVLSLRDWPGTRVASVTTKTSGSVAVRSGETVLGRSTGRQSGRRTTLQLQDSMRRQNRTSGIMADRYSANRSVGAHEWRSGEVAHIGLGAAIRRQNCVFVKSMLASGCESGP